MKLVVGLGNPGEKFQYTRHNIGFMVVEKFVKDKFSLLPSLKAWKKDNTFKAELCKYKDILVVKPLTFMNLVGVSVAKVVNFYKVDPKEIWVVHDDIDLPVGKIRIRFGGASAGHHGIESLIQELKTSEFVRLRLGIGRGKLNIRKTADQNLHRRVVEKFVVSPFRDFEGGEVKKLIKNAVDALGFALDHSIEKAMNRYN